MVLTLHPLIVSSQSSVLTTDLRVVVIDASQLPFCFVKSDLLRAKVVRTKINQLLGVLDAAGHALELMVEALLFLGLVVCLKYFLVAHFLQLAYFAPHLSSLNLDLFYFCLYEILLLAEVSHLVSLRHGLFAQASGLEVFFIEHALAPADLVAEVAILFGLFAEVVLELLELATSVLDIVDGTVELKSVIVLAPGLVVAEHAVAVFHRENFIVDATVVAVLVAQIK